MIKLSDKVYVSASAVKSIQKDYGQSIYRKLDELVEAVRQDSGVSK